MSANPYGRDPSKVQSDSEAKWEAFRFLKLRQYFTPIYVSDAEVQAAWEEFAVIFSAEDGNA